MQDEFYQRMKEMLKDEYEDWRSCLEKPRYRGLRINPKKLTKEEFEAAAKFDFQSSPFAKSSYYVQEALGLHPWHAAGAIYLQEPSASAPVTLLDIQPHDYVLDVCAAPGSKSTQILANLTDGFLLANEIDPKRAQILLSNLERMGAVNFACTNMDPASLCAQVEGSFDKVLVDAPCSGEGMMRKHEEAQNQWSLENIQHCARLQKDILDQAVRALKPGGILVYSTCTYAMEENEEQIAAFLQRHPEMELMPIQADFGRSGLLTDGLDSTKVRRIFPMDHGEGHFMAKFVKTEGHAGSLKTEKSARPEKLVKEFLQDNLDISFSNYLEHSQRNGEKVWYAMNAPFLKLKGKVLRQGVQLGKVVKNRFEPAHALYLCTDACSHLLHSVNVSLQEMDDFYHGQQLFHRAPKGWVGLCYEDICFGFGKSDGKVIKNKLPRGLRLLPNSHLHL